MAGYTVEEARKLGELLGMRRQAESAMTGWPALKDDRVVSCAEAYQKAHDELRVFLKEHREGD